MQNRMIPISDIPDDLMFVIYGWISLKKGIPDRDTQAPFEALLPTGDQVYLTGSLTDAMRFGITHYRELVSSD